MTWNPLTFLRFLEVHQLHWNVLFHKQICNTRCSNLIDQMQKWPENYSGFIFGKFAWLASFYGHVSFNFTCAKEASKANIHRDKRRVIFWWPFLHLVNCHHNNNKTLTCLMFFRVEAGLALWLQVIKLLSVGILKSVMCIILFYRPWTTLWGVANKATTIIYLHVSKLNEVRSSGWE